MEIMEIIKESFVFPSKNGVNLAIYIVLTIVAALLLVGGLVSVVFGIAGESAGQWIVGIILFILSLLVGFVISGYQISIIKSGIDMDEASPGFEWKENLFTGVKYVIVDIVYFIIPAIIVLIVGWATNLFGNAWTVFYKVYEANLQAATADVAVSTPIAVTDVVSQSVLSSLGNAMIITGVVALIVFLIFVFIQTMAESRLANTGSLGDALNIPEAFKDIGRIGWGKVIATLILIFVIILVVNGIISFIANYVSILGFLSIIVTPYLIFFASRATGLLYSDIA